MTEKESKDFLQNLRDYIVEETRRLDHCGGRVHHINLDEIDDEGKCLIPAPKLDPIERDLDTLFSANRDRDKSRS